MREKHQNTFAYMHQHRKKSHNYWIMIFLAMLIHDMSMYVGLVDDLAALTI